MISNEIASNLHCKRDTLGQQVLDVHAKYADQKTQEIRETTNEMGKEYMQSLWSVIKAHEHVKGEYYIMEILKRDAVIPNAIHCKHVARKTRPKPEFGLGLYRVDNTIGECFYEWGLPHEAEADLMMANPLGWDKEVVQNIRDFQAGTLV